MLKKIFNIRQAQITYCYDCINSSRQKYFKRFVFIILYSTYITPFFVRSIYLIIGHVKSRFRLYGVESTINNYVLKHYNTYIYLITHYHNFMPDFQQVLCFMRHKNRHIKITLTNGSTSVLLMNRTSRMCVKFKLRWNNKDISSR